MTEPQDARRRFLIQAAVAATAVPLLARMAFTPARADALKKLTLDNPQAKALHYAADAATVKDPAYKAGSLCSNCQLFIPATGGCELFPDFSVDPKGWCSAWAGPTKA
jgi:high potential iron-sulfur protein